MGAFKEIYIGMMDFTQEEVEPQVDQLELFGILDLLRRQSGHEPATEVATPIKPLPEVNSHV